MTTFTLLVIPGGRAMLTTTEQLDDRQLAEVQRQVRGWKDGEWPVMVIPDCAVVQVAEIDLDLTPKSAGALS